MLTFVHYSAQNISTFKTNIIDFLTLVIQMFSNCDNNKKYIFVQITYLQIPLI